MEKKYIFISPEHLDFLDYEELNIDPNDFIWSNDNSMTYYSFVNEPTCIQELRSVHEYILYNPEDAEQIIEDRFNALDISYGFIKTENLHNINFLDVAEKVVYNRAGDMFMISWEGETPSALSNILEYSTDLDGAMIYEKEVFNGN